MQQPRPLVISTAPFDRQGGTTNRMMAEVLIALAPVALAAIWFFGVVAILVPLAAAAGACLVEWLAGDRKGLGSLRDGSALLTGLLLAYTLPPGVALWIAFLGGAVAIGLGKLIWGGLGQNIFNPALVGRAFLQAAFPTVMTTWTAPGQDFFHISGQTFAAPLMHGSVDGVTAATALGRLKFQHDPTALDLSPLFWGNTGGSLGETSAFLLIAAALFLIARRTFDWRLFVSTLAGAAAVSGALFLANTDKYPNPLFMLFAGGLMFGAVFMVTDPVTSPITPKGAWIFGAGVGLLVVIIRLFGGLPESVMYSILLMNALTPHINRKTQPRRFGG
ncbi:RnfABCDGE type electron transport complex subunit D [bacterium]|nr:RnfABCDGE type electron transport complex subunit D [bacterium]